MSNLAELDRLIPQYAANKSEMDSYKKICDRENAEIKTLMADLELPQRIVGGYKAIRSVQRRETINEELLLAIAHKYNLFDVIKTKEYIDFDALEHAIYIGRISSNVLLEMDKAKEVKEVVTLTIKKVKKEETENV